MSKIGRRAFQAALVPAILLGGRSLAEAAGSGLPARSTFSVSVLPPGTEVTEAASARASLSQRTTFDFQEALPFPNGKLSRYTAGLVVTLVVREMGTADAKVAVNLSNSDGSFNTVGSMYLADINQRTWQSEIRVPFGTWTAVSDDARAPAVRIKLDRA